MTARDSPFLVAPVLGVSQSAVSQPTHATEDISQELGMNRGCAIAAGAASGSSIWVDGPIGGSMAARFTRLPPTEQQFKQAFCAVYEDNPLLICPSNMGRLLVHADTAWLVFEATRTGCMDVLVRKLLHLLATKNGASDVATRLRLMSDEIIAQLERASFDVPSPSDGHLLLGAVLPVLKDRMSMAAAARARTPPRTPSSRILARPMYQIRVIEAVC